MLEKKNQHVLVTGPSGAGKSTLAKQLAAERGMPLARIDSSPSWNAMFANDPEDKHMVPGTAEHAYYQTLRRRLAAAVMRRRTPSVIEGTQLLTLSPERIAGHEMHLIAPPRDVVLDRRWNRLSTNSKNVHRADDPAWRADKYRVANALYDDAAPDIARLREIPGIHIKESAYRVLDDLKRAKSESDRGNYRAKHHILSKLLSEWPDEFVVDSRRGSIVGLTHPKTGFKIHAPAAITQGQTAKEKPYRDRVEMYGVHPSGKILGGLYKDDRTFGTFGGGIDPGEDPATAGAREFFEESGHRIHDPVLLNVPPSIQDWGPPYRTPQQAERSKWFRGSRTQFAAGRLGDEPPVTPAATDPSHLKRIGLRRLSTALKRVRDLQSAPIHAGRIAALEALARHPLVTGEKAAAWGDLVRPAVGALAGGGAGLLGEYITRGHRPASLSRRLGFGLGGALAGSLGGAALNPTAKPSASPSPPPAPPVPSIPSDLLYRTRAMRKELGDYLDQLGVVSKPVTGTDRRLRLIDDRNISSGVLPSLPFDEDKAVRLRELLDAIVPMDKRGAVQAFTYVPTAVKDQVLREGLYSSKALLRRPDLHAAIAKARGEDLGKWQSDIKERLKSWKPEASLGPSVFFQGHEPPDLDVLPKDHPLKTWDLSKINIDLESILKRRKSTRVHGLELVPYDEAEYDKDPEGYVHKRHHDLTSKEMGEISGRSASDIWSNYNNAGKVLYAGSVPHASVITRGGVIPPRYLKAASYRRRPGRIPLCMIKIALEPDQVRLNQFLGDEAQARRDRVSPLQYGMNRAQDAADVFGRAGYAMQGGLYGGIGTAMSGAAFPANVAGQVGAQLGVPGARDFAAGARAFGNTGREAASAGMRDVRDYLNNPVMPKGNVNQMNEANRAALTESGHPWQAGLGNVADYAAYGATQALPSVLGGVGVGQLLKKFPQVASGASQALTHANRSLGPLKSYGTEALETFAPRAMQLGRAVAPRVQPLLNFGRDVAKGWFGHGATDPINVGKSFVPAATNTVKELGKGVIPMPSQQLYADTKEKAQGLLGAGSEVAAAPAPATASTAPPSRPMTMAARQPAPPAAPTVAAQRRPVPPPVAPPPRPAPPPVAPPPRPAPPPLPGRFPAPAPGKFPPSFRGGLPPSIPSMKAAGLFPRLGSRVQQGHAAILRPAGMAVHTEPVTKTADLLPWVSLQPQQKRVAKRVREGENLLVYHGLGSGKSLAGIAAAEGVGGPYTAVVPASLRPNYEGEISKFSDKATPSEVMSYTGVGMGKQPTRAPETIIMDEVQRLRNPASEGSRAAMEMAMKAKHRILLSGTPIVNAPSDLAVPLSILRGEEMSPASFDRRFVGSKTVDPGWMGWFQGVQPTKVPTLQNEDDLEKMLAGHVDYQPSRTPEGVKTLDERVDVDLSPEQQDFYKLMWGKLPWMMRWKLSNDYPLSKQEIAHLSSFMTGPRQAALSLYPFHSSKDPMRAFQTSSKLQSAMGSLKETLAKDPRAKALVYSNFIDAGLTPYAAALQAEKIPYGQFHGTMTEEDRKRALDDYNEGRSRVLLLGPAAAEGISARGTQLIQLLDPHWNEARLGQARGRGLRFDSHEGLPPELRNVRIQRFVAKMPPPGWLGRLFGDTSRPSADEILEQQSHRKEELNEQFREVLRRVGSPGYEKPWSLFG